MRFRMGILLIAVASLFFAIGRTTAERSTDLNRQTRDNLSTAMHGEAFAYAKYLLYAQHAQQNGNLKIANLFADTASVERFQHFAEEAQLAGLVGSEVDNLKDAIKGESYEVDTMYADFAKQATAAGDKEAAERFEEIRQDEMSHRDLFKSALVTIQQVNAGASHP